MAGLVGRSESWLSQVERGLRTVDSYSVLNDLARVLRVDIGTLTDDSSTGEPGRTMRTPDVVAIERALLVGGSAVPEAMLFWPSPNSTAPIRPPDTTR